ncbi:Na+/H+ antiporter NhaA [Parafilimonas terrae]|uniref:Na(+)/H(+) antiporter NhaA n=1 Tax=Parafilimonas terrae TaxID=1465490 RepID=A0A1I5TGH2_9BACT|nr:Na+/H+ antiporter NhaA [Parafilimonas terrae]SFP82172.1 sodium/proton antiporter, NhaA family [Parafilimonas terrae]
MQLTRLFNEFFNSEKASGIILIFVTILSIAIANSSLQIPYINFWHTDIGGHDIVHWINDGLMTIFFLLIGLELEREIYHGELSNFRTASLPIFAAIGGMFMPAAIYLLFNYGTETRAGAGIPMATDIAFAIGILSLLGRRVNPSLKIFLTALAVIDDLGAIIIIAIFYTQTIAWLNLLIALAIFIVLLILNRLKVHNLIPYILGGILMWWFMLHSGVHATISGVLLAFTIPFKNGDEKSPSYKLQHFLHKPVSFFILPLFAIANTCIAIPANWVEGLAQASSIGVITGLVIGKPLGISLFSFAAVKTGLCQLPSQVSWKNIIGAGMLAGIGFTMSIFITMLAFKDEDTINNAKIAILMGSVISGIAGLLWLRITLRKQSITPGQ